MMPMPRVTRRLLLLAPVLLAAGACGQPVGSPDGRDTPHAIEAMDRHAPTMDDAAAASYNLGLPGGKTIKLKGGVGTDAASGRRVELARDFRMIGDLDRDGHDEAAVVLVDGTGPSRTLYLSVLNVADGLVETLASAVVGRSLQLRDARIENRRIVLRVLRPVAGDQECCPSEEATLQWTFAGGKLSLTNTATAERKPADLAGTRWLLRAFDFDDKAPIEPAVSLQLEEGKVTGSTGCNQYTATFAPGEHPGQVRVTDVTTSNRTCAGPASDLEKKYLAALRGVRGWGFYLGQLAVTWQDAGGPARTLLFSRQGG